jgi:hypothetical protein
MPAIRIQITKRASSEGGVVRNEHKLPIPKKEDRFAACGRYEVEDLLLGVGHFKQAISPQLRAASQDQSSGMYGP